MLAGTMLRWLQIMISNTLLFLQLREDSVLHLQAIPQNSLLWIHLWPSWFWLAWVSKSLQCCGCPCEAKAYEVTFRSPRELLIAVFYICVLYLRSFYWFKLIYPCKTAKSKWGRISSWTSNQKITETWKWIE